MTLAEYAASLVRIRGLENKEGHVQEPQNETRSIAEMYMDGDGQYDTCIQTISLGDGTYLVYEKQKLPGPCEGIARVRRVSDTASKEYLPRGTTPYLNSESDQDIIRRLNTLLMKPEFHRYE